MTVRADRLHRAHHLSITHRLSGTRSEDDIVHGEDSHDGAAESFDGQPPHAVLLHRLECGSDVVVWAACVHRHLEDLTNADLRRALVPRRQSNVHIAIGNDSYEPSV